MPKKIQKKDAHYKALLEDLKKKVLEKGYKFKMYPIRAIILKAGSLFIQGECSALSKMADICADIGYCLNSCDGYNTENFDIFLNRSSIVGYHCIVFGEKGYGDFLSFCEPNDYEKFCKAQGQYIALEAAFNRAHIAAYPANAMRTFKRRRNQHIITACCNTIYFMPYSLDDQVRYALNDTKQKYYSEHTLGLN